MRYHILKKKDLDRFVREMSKKMKFVAPVKKGDSFVFSEVESAEAIALKYLPTILPPKKYFMPPREEMIQFDMSERPPKETALADIEPIVLFGVHTCDMAGLLCLNIVFSEDPKDYNFRRRAEKIFLVGLECNELCDENANCVLANSHIPSGGGYDMFFTDIGESFFVHARTERAESLAKSFDFMPEARMDHVKLLDKLRSEKREKFSCDFGKRTQEVYYAFSKGMNSRVWEEIGERCLSCGNCTNVCPTCYCFDMTDLINLDMKTGARVRLWDSCQYETFAVVAGGENFRESRAERQRHRYYRKFKYSYDKYDRFFCTGCGRCTRTCMAGIDLKETLKSLIRDMYEKGN